MKILNILIFIILFTNAFCLFRKKHSAIGKKKHAAKAKQLEDYALALINQINIFRTEHSYIPEIVYNEELQQTASQEAQNLIDQQNFGQHENFPTLRNEIDNEFLTEIVLKLTFTDELPPAEVFCQVDQSYSYFKQFVYDQHVVEEIAKSEERYLSYEYNNGGATIQQDLESGLYFIVIHLAKLAGSNEPEGPQVFPSCKVAQEQGYNGSTILINVNGEEKEVACEQEYADGGWTLVLDEHEDLEKDNILPIDTMGIEYTQILFKVDEGYEFNSRNSDPQQYKYDGFLFQANALKFGEKWYISEEFDINFSYDRDHLEEKSFYKQADQITVVEPSETCYFEDSNLPNYCAKAFIFNPPLPEGELNAISDVESLGKYAYQNNKWNAYFKLYLR